MSGDGSTVILHTSDPNREAVGAIVEFEVERNGTCVAHVLDRRIDDNFVFFEEVAGDVIESSSSFTGGDMVSFEVGDTE